MSEFNKIFKKVNGMQKLKEYASAHVLMFALTETLLVGFSRKSLEIVRLAVSNKIYRRLKKKNTKFISDFKNKNDFSSAEHKHRRTIWTIWLQGMDQAPRIVQQCYKSMCDHLKDWEIVVITEENYSDYVTFPDHIMEKYKAGIISKVHFSDLLRIELLANHGGTWLDGTVFCSGAPSQDFFLESDLFLYQCLKPGFDGHSSCISSWMMTGSTNHPIIMLTRALLHNYWKHYNKAVDYFILHDFFQMAIEAYPEEWKKVVPLSNAMPHVLLLRLFDKYDPELWNALRSITPFHKLSYKFDKSELEKEKTYYTEILGK